MWVATCAASCCASCACEGCKALASSISRRSARVAYCFLFTMSLIVAWVMRDFAEPVLESIPWIDHIVQTPDKEWFQTQAVLRVSFASFVFFLGFALIMIGVKDQSDQRDSWHHGGWMIKFIAWAVLIVLSFLLPNGLVNAYGSMARFGSGFFLLIQVLILLDFTHHWNTAWVEKDETFWYVALLAASAVCYTITFVLSGFLFHWFAASAEGCELNTFFITVTLLLAVAFTVVSLHPQINGSLLPAAVISMYCMYLNYTALSSEPRDYECNGLHKHTAAVSTGTMVMGMMTTLLSVAYSAVRAGSSTTFLSPPSSPRAGNRSPLLTERDMEEDPEMDDDSREMKMTRGSSKKDRQPVSYVYSFFHLIFALASMYSAMLLTGWGNSNVDQDVVDVGWSSVWVRIITQWITAILYIWSLVAPYILPDRDFS